MKFQKLNESGKLAEAQKLLIFTLVFIAEIDERGVLIVCNGVY